MKLPEYTHEDEAGVKYAERRELLSWHVIFSRIVSGFDIESSEPPSDKILVQT